MLILATAAAAKERALLIDPVRGRGQNFEEIGFREDFVIPIKPDHHPLSPGG